MTTVAEAGYIEQNTALPDEHKVKGMIFDWAWVAIEEFEILKS